MSFTSAYTIRYLHTQYHITDGENIQGHIY